MINYKLGSVIDEMKIDYTLLYTCFDVLDILGFISRKSDANCNQRFLVWAGFRRFKNKHQHLFDIALGVGSKDNLGFEGTLKKHEKFSNAIFLDKFL